MGLNARPFGRNSRGSDPLADVLPPGASTRTRKGTQLRELATQPRNVSGLTPVSGGFNVTLDNLGIALSGDKPSTNVLWAGSQLIFALDVDDSRPVTVCFRSSGVWACYAVTVGPALSSGPFAGMRSCSAPKGALARPLAISSTDPDSRVACRLVSWQLGDTLASCRLVSQTAYFTGEGLQSFAASGVKARKCAPVFSQTQDGYCGSWYFDGKGLIGCHVGGTEVPGKPATARNLAYIPQGPSMTSISLRPRQRAQRSEYVQWPEARRNAESLVAGPSAPTSDYYGPTSASEDSAGSYVEMLVNPWSGALCRLPDANIAPTSLAKFIKSRTYTCSGIAPTDGYDLYGINSRLACFNIIRTLDTAEPGYPTTGQTSAPYQYTPGPILSQVQMQLTGDKFKGLSVLTDNPSYPWGQDYGPPQSQTCSWTAAYRTLALAMRVRVVGLPASTFMAPGKVYFAQVRANYSDLPITEQDYVNLERIGRATHVSLDAVRESGSKTFFAVPDSADKFVLSSTFPMAPGEFDPKNDDGLAVRQFPAVNGPFIPDNSYTLIPYQTATTNATVAAGSRNLVGNPTDAATADQTMILLMAVFGAASGVILEVNYATVVEYIPTGDAPPGVETRVQLPNSPAMDTIFAAAAVANGVRPRLVQAPGDRTITDLRSSSAAPAAVAAARTTVEAVRSMARKSAGRSVRPEGWFDWLGDFDLKWGDFAMSSKPKAKRR